MGAAMRKKDGAGQASGVVCLWSSLWCLVFVYLSSQKKACLVWYVLCGVCLVWCVLCGVCYVVCPCVFDSCLVHDMTEGAEMTTSTPLCGMPLLYLWRDSSMFVA